MRLRITLSTSTWLCLPLLAALAQPALCDPLQGGVQKEDRSPMQAGAEFTVPHVGQMQFSSKVEAVEPKFRPNKLFAATNLPEEGVEDGWYLIPAWRAGKFHRESQTDHTLFGDQTIVSRVDHVYGMQRDKNGGIWHHYSWPKITRVELDGYDEYKIVHRYEPVKITPTEFAVKVNSTDIDVDVNTGKIKRVTKQEEFDQYFPLSEGTVRGESKWQGFSMNGGPNTTVERSSLEEVQTEPFRVINTWKGKDLRESFRKFLQSHELSELLPD